MPDGQPVIGWKILFLNNIVQVHRDSGTRSAQQCYRLAVWNGAGCRQDRHFLNSLVQIHGNLGARSAQQCYRPAVWTSVDRLSQTQHEKRVNSVQ